MSSKDKHQTEEIIIEKNVVIDASPEVVFKAITDPKELTNWFPDHAILEPKLGGKVKFSFYKDKELKELLLNLFQTRKYLIHGTSLLSMTFQKQL
jgi:activator of Hsp90 ATPase-like protein